MQCILTDSQSYIVYNERIKNVESYTFLKKKFTYYTFSRVVVAKIVNIVQKILALANAIIFMFEIIWQLELIDKILHFSFQGRS